MFKNVLPKSPTTDDWDDITLALAGVFQAAALVEQLAKTGYVPPESFRTCIESLFELNPQSTELVFGDKSKLEIGLEALSNLLLYHQNKENKGTLRYVLGILHLQKKLSSQKDMLQIISTRVQQAMQQAEHFSSTHENVISNLASIYTDTLSTFRFRIQVIGEYNYLQQPRIANQMRSLLFAGVRAATLWRQVGGSRWQVLIHRRRLSSSADDILRRVRNG